MEGDTVRVLYDPHDHSKVAFEIRRRTVPKDVMRDPAALANCVSENEEQPGHPD